MARPSIENFYDLSQPAAKQQLIRELATLQGVYEVKIVPRRATRSQAQNRWYFGVICRYFADYLSAQDYNVTTVEGAHEILKAKFLMTGVVNPETGELIANRVRSTTELSTGEFSEYTDRCRVWLQDFFGIIVPDPDPSWAVPPTARAPKEAHAV